MLHIALALFLSDLGFVQKFKEGSLNLLMDIFDNEGFLNEIKTIAF